MNASRERGVVLLLIVLMILAVAAMGAIMAGSISSSDITDSHLNGYAIEAQFAAESGVERALEEFSNTAYAPPPAAAVNPCVAGAFNAGPFTVAAGRTFTTTFKGATDFDGVTALPFSRCRVQIIGSVTGAGVTRALQAVLDRNLLAGANPDFNDIVGGAGTAVSGWTSVATPIPFDFAGGPETAPTAVPATRCTRAAYAAKSRSAANGGIIARSTGSVPIVPNFVVTAGQTVTVRFNVRVIQIADSSSTNTCTTAAAGVVVPGGAPAGNAQIWFSLTDSANAVFTTAGARVVAVAMTNPGAPLNTRTIGDNLPCTPTTQQATAATDYPSCASFYAFGTPANKQQSTVVVGGTGIIKQLNYFIVLAAAGAAREAWIDNIELINGTGTRIARTDEWRDCAVSSCP